MLTIQSFIHCPSSAFLTRLQKENVNLTEEELCAISTLETEEE